MDWKKFFAPTWCKLLLAAALFIVFVPFIEHDTGIRCITFPCNSSSASPILMYFFASSVSSATGHIYQFLFFHAIAGAILSYVVSAAILFSIKSLDKIY